MGFTGFDLQPRRPGSRRERDIEQAGIGRADLHGPAVEPGLVVGSGGEAQQQGDVPARGRGFEIDLGSVVLTVVGEPRPGECGIESRRGMADPEIAVKPS